MEQEKLGNTEVLEIIKRFSPIAWCHIILDGFYQLKVTYKILADLVFYERNTCLIGYSVIGTTLNHDRPKQWRTFTRPKVWSWGLWYLHCMDRKIPRLGDYTFTYPNLE